MGERRESRFSQSFGWFCCRRPGRSVLCVWLDCLSYWMAWLERGLCFQAFPSSMTGCRAWMMLGLMVWRLVLAMARAVECLVRCCGGCRGFAQLREGSDDPPPPVRMGASAWADAMPRPASRPSRMVVIAKVRRRRETRCMKPKPLHQTPNGTNTACLFKVLPASAHPASNRRSRWRKPAAFSTPPASHPTTQSANNTRDANARRWVYATTPPILPAG